MARIGFCGGAYQSAAFSADYELCRNYIPEKDESGLSKSGMQLISREGLSVWCDDATNGISVRAEYVSGTTNRAFAVIGAALYELTPNGSTGTKTNRGTVANDSLPASIAGNKTQVMVCSGTRLYLLDLASNTFTADPAGADAFVMVVGSDQYFIALRSDGAILVSAVGDGSSWPGLQVQFVSAFDDLPQSIAIDHRELFVWGTKRSAVYYDSGSQAVFDLVSNGIMEEGTSAAFGSALLDNTVFWWGGDERGGISAYRAGGYTPQRVSNHGVEQIIAGYTIVYDAISWAYERAGHKFWVTLFPNAGATWVYDVTTGLWHERTFFDGTTETAFRGQCHMFFRGLHLVGDRSTGKIFKMAAPSVANNAWTLADDFGNKIKRRRTSPYVCAPNRYVQASAVEVLCDSGLPLYNGSTPQMSLDWSDDGGHNFSAPRTVPLGGYGDYKKRQRIYRIGTWWGSRGRIFGITSYEPHAITDVELDGSDFQSQKRLLSELAERA